ncbi:MAG: ComEA family DNA-binding protein [Cyanobacteria bacterium P01_A01_bin.105]
MSVSKNSLGWQRRFAAQALKGLDYVERRLNPLRSRLQHNPYYRFCSVKEVAAAARLGVKIDVNRATVDDWLRLPGISIHQARTLVELTQRGTPLLCLEDVAAAVNLPLSRLLPLVSILDFRYYDEGLARPLSLNHASGVQLMQIPGLDRALAQQLLYHRRFGPYRSWDDVQQRLRLSPQQVTQLIHYLGL